MIAQRLRVMQILWGSLLFSTFMFVVILYTVPHAVPRVPEPIILPALGASALVTAVLGVFFPDQQRKRAFLAVLSKLVVERPNPAAEVTFREAAPPIKAFDDVRVAWERALPVYQTGLILKLALAEAVAMTGFVAAWIGFPNLYALPFFGVTWILMLARFPTAAGVARAVKDVIGVDLPIEG